MSSNLNLRESKDDVQVDVDPRGRDPLLPRGAARPRRRSGGRRGGRGRGRAGRRRRRPSPPPRPSPPSRPSSPSPSSRPPRPSSPPPSSRPPRPSPPPRPPRPSRPSPPPSQQRLSRPRTASRDGEGGPRGPGDAGGLCLAGQPSRATELDRAAAPHRGAAVESGGERAGAREPAPPDGTAAAPASPCVPSSGILGRRAKAGEVSLEEVNRALVTRVYVATNLNKAETARRLGDVRRRRLRPPRPAQPTCPSERSSFHAKVADTSSFIAGLEPS